MIRALGLQHLLTRLRHLVLAKPRQEIDEELAFHLEQSTQAHLDAGLTAAQARRQALLDLGSTQAARAQAHEQRPTFRLETLAQDITFSLRALRRNRAFTLTTVAILMLGIGATTAVFSVVDPILFRSLPYGHAGQLVSVGMDAPIMPDEFMLGGSYYEWQDNQRPFTAMTSETGTDPCDLNEEHPTRLTCAWVEANFLPTLEVNPVAGRNFTVAEDTPHGPGAAIISYALWKTRYAARPDIAGTLLHLDGRAVPIVGVLPDGFQMPRLQKVDVLLPQALDVAAQRHAMPGRPMWAFARLKAASRLPRLACNCSRCLTFRSPRRPRSFVRRSTCRFAPCVTGRCNTCAPPPGCSSVSSSPCCSSPARTSQA